MLHMFEHIDNYISNIHCGKMYIGSDCLDKFYKVAGILDIVLWVD
jgi:hypothetical protein